MIEFIMSLTILICVVGVLYTGRKNKTLSAKNAEFETRWNAREEQLNKQLREFQQTVLEAHEELGHEREKNRNLLSQKKSSETRLGTIGEQLVPFLSGCRHNPSDMIFLGRPIDYVVINFDQGEIIFLEVKTGNSKPSERQKVIKNIIRSGRVYYEEIRINEKGVKSKLYPNLEAEKKEDGK